MTLEATSDYHIQTGTQRAQLGVVGNFVVSVHSQPASQRSRTSIRTAAATKGGSFEGAEPRQRA